MKRIILPVLLGAMALGMAITAWLQLSGRSLSSLDPRTRLEDSIIIRDIEMESDVPLAETDSEVSPEGQVIYDDGFSRDQAPALKEAERRLSGKKRFEAIRKRDRRWHLVKYTIRKNDNLWKIARAHGVSHELIIGINDINRPDMLAPGNNINIPSRRGVYHVVKRGETLPRIAHDYRIQARVIGEHNQVTSQRLKVGQRLFLPGAQERPAAKPVERAVARKKPAREAREAAPVEVPAPRPEGTTASISKPAVRAPFLWPVVGRITSGFGNRRDPFSGKKSFHCGIDISANSGQPIKAAADGRVIFSGWKPGYGNVVIIRHEGGYITVYAHNSKNVVTEETRVTRGELIAYSGNTGAVTGAHLHFEIRKGVGFPLNPLRLLK